MYYGELDGEFLHHGQWENDEKGPYLFKLFDFVISLRFFRRKIIVFFPSMMILIAITVNFSQIIEKNLGVGWVNGHQFAIS